MNSRARARLHRRGLLRSAARPPRPRPPPRRRPRGRVRRRRRLQPRPPGPPLRLPGPPAGGAPQGRLRRRVRPPADLRRPPRPAPAPDPGGRRRVRAGRPRRAVPPRQAPEGPGRPLDRRPGPLRLPLRPGPRRRPGPPGGRRRRGRGGADALPLADRRADDRPPDPQAARRRPVAAAVRQAALVELRRAPHPLRPGLHRHRLRQPARLRRAPQAAIDGPEGRDGDLPSAAAARGVDPDPGPGHHRRGDVSGREGATRPQLGPVLPEQHPQRLPAAVPADAAGRAAWRCTGSRRTTAGKRHEYRYYKCHGKDTVARDRACRCTQTPAKVDELDAAVWGHVKALLEDPAAPGRAVRGAGAAVGGAGRRPTPRSERWEAQLQRLGREEQRLVDAYQAEVIDLDELRDRREQIRGRREVLDHPARPGATSCRPSVRRRRRSGRTWRRSAGGCGRGSTRRRWPSGSGSCSC